MNQTTECEPPSPTIQTDETNDVTMRPNATAPPATSRKRTNSYDGNRRQHGRQQHHGRQHTARRPKTTIRPALQRRLWKMFDDEIGSTAAISAEETTDLSSAIECLYDTSSSTNCSVCNSILGVNEERFLCCTNNQCGIVYKNVTDNGAEWKFVSDDGVDGSRCGMPTNPLLAESSYGCAIPCRGSTTYEMRKLKRYSEWQSMPYKEKTLFEDFKHITMMSDLAGIPRIIIDDAMRYYTLLSANTKFRGMNRNGIVAASIYISCRINQVPRTPKEIAAIFNIDTSGCTKMCKIATAVLRELESNDDTMRSMTLTNMTPSVFVERFCSKLGMSEELTKLAAFIAVIVETRNLIPSNTPNAVAAGIVYFVNEKCNVKLTKPLIAEIVDISEVTITKCYRQLDESPIQLVPQVILDKYRGASLPRTPPVRILGVGGGLAPG